MGENGVDRDAKRAMEPKLATGQNKRSRLMKLAHRLFHPGERLSQRVVHAGFLGFRPQDHGLVCKELGWKPRFTGLGEIVWTAWEWRRTR